MTGTVSSKLQPDVPHSIEAVIEAIRFRDIERLRTLLVGLSKEEVSALSDEGVTALSIAVVCEEEEALRILLEHGADPNRLNIDGTTCLSSVSCIVICRTLLAYGARVVDEKPDDGETSVHQAAAMGRVEILVELLAADGQTALSKFDNCGWTPLHLTVFYGHPECIRILLGHGSDPNFKRAETFGRSAMELAKSCKNPEILSLLADAGGVL